MNACDCSSDRPGRIDAPRSSEDYGFTYLINTYTRHNVRSFCPFPINDKEILFFDRLIENATDVTLLESKITISSGNVVVREFAYVESDNKNRSIITRDKP